jgi:ATP-dependent Clp protease ATP-binding subunit ClpA
MTGDVTRSLRVVAPAVLALLACAQNAVSAVTPQTPLERQVRERLDALGSFLDRLTPPAAQALFFARGAVSQYGGAQLDSTDLLLGILQAAPEAIMRFTASGLSVESMKERAVATLPPAPKLAEAAEVPFSPGLRRTIERAVRAADNAAARDIRPEHLVLIVLDDVMSAAGQVLRDAGVSRDAVTAFLRQQ